MGDFHVGIQGEETPQRAFAGKAVPSAPITFAPPVRLGEAASPYGIHFFQVVIATQLPLVSLSAQQLRMVRCLVLRLPVLPVCLVLVQLLSPCSGRTGSGFMHLKRLHLGPTRTLGCTPSLQGPSRRTCVRTEFLSRCLSPRPPC